MENFIFLCSLEYKKHLQENKKTNMNVHRNQNWWNFYDCCFLDRAFAGGNLPGALPLYPFVRYLWQALVSICDGALRDGFDFFFSGDFY